MTSSWDNPFHQSDSTDQHRADAPAVVCCAVLTVSDTRTREDDSSGRMIREHLGFRGHEIVDSRIVKDEESEIRQTLTSWLADSRIQAIVINGGTGIAGRDVKFPTVTSLIQKEMPGFGELFRMLSYEEVGAASMLSRATAGVVNRTVVFSLPGSVNAVRLAMEKLIGPELGHIVHEITRQG